MTTRVHAVAIASLIAACFDPTYDHPRCGPGESCPSGWTCVATWCEPQAPTVDATADGAPRCDAGQSCPADHTCVDGVCVPDGPVPCGADDSCPSGQSCSGGFCL